MQRQPKADNLHFELAGSVTAIMPPAAESRALHGVFAERTFFSTSTTKNVHGRYNATK